MENVDLFDFEFDFDEDCWTVTGYYGKSEEVIFPAAYEGKPVKKIGDYFSPYKKRIKSVIIPEGFTYIGKRAFKECTGLTNVKFPKGLNSIGKRALENCTVLTNINFPEGLTSIGKWAFDGCTGLMNINFPESLTSIGEEAFLRCTGLTNIKFPKNLTSIGKEAFLRCTGLTSIRFPKGLTSIGEWTFGLCTELEEIIVDENNPVFCSLDGVMFDKAMTTLVGFPPGNKGKYSVPDGIMRIESGAFDWCNKISSISLPQSLLSIETFMINGEQLTDITVNELNPNYCSIDGVLFDKEKKELLIYPKNKDKTDYTIPDGVLRIAYWAFSGCKRIVNIKLPESLELVGRFAFDGCEGLKAIILPINLQYVEDCAFIGCSNLETITLSRKTRILWDKACFDSTGKLVYRD
jgi:hypothetical protein